ncbi:YeeE/YedE thiosulfate transporter family protein [Roseomonas sp. CAU 1739]|uniref:YeeE/YedE thiosulfate transporter family protein n=1 Tax=Roseomonas sp. CAU 1739 TaxID=3140364 RepID=UPI00325AFC52
MDTYLLTPAFLIATACAGMMGFAIQRGATCTVAAVEEILERRSAGRLVAMVEAAAWVAAGLVVAQVLGALGTMPVGYPVQERTIGGAVLLGLGAWLNRACAFGSIARLGSGEWAYLATPVGYLAGCLAFAPLGPQPGPVPLAEGSPILQAPAWIVLPLVAVMAWRLARHAGGSWTPHAATTVIGITFLITLLLVGAWSYTDLLAELARGMAGGAAARGVLFLALLAGAILGGWIAGRPGGTRMTPRALLRCFAGGAVMALGALLVPGGNDGLILLGMPLLWPYAWVAFLTMCVTVGMARLAQGGLSRFTATRRARTPRAGA